MGQVLVRDSFEISPPPSNLAAQTASIRPNGANSAVLINTRTSIFSDACERVTRFGGLTDDIHHTVNCSKP
ncbi:MAG: hypothetical protein CBD11_00825 [Phycisphaera sp. TMED151]|nr:MAG: hypothetical protein CBD11_00825 [Phycisphaera sp. TMED151]